MPLAIDRTNSPITAAEAIPNSNAAGLVVPDGAKGLHCTVQPPLINVTDYTIACFGVIDDEVGTAGSTTSAYPDGVDWPELDQTRSTKTGSAHFVFPVDGERRMLPVVVDENNTGAIEIILKGRWIFS